MSDTELRYRGSGDAKAAKRSEASTSRVEDVTESEAEPPEKPKEIKYPRLEAVKDFMEYLTTQDGVNVMSEWFLILFPIIDSFFVFLLISQPRENERPPLQPGLLYAHIFIMCLMSWCMIHRRKVTDNSLVYAAQLVHLAIVFHVSDRFSYDIYLKRKIIMMHVGVIGVYMLTSKLRTTRKHDPLPLAQIGQLVVVSFMIFCIGNLIFEGYESEALMSIGAPHWLTSCLNAFFSFVFVLSGFLVLLSFNHKRPMRLAYFLTSLVMFCIAVLYDLGAYHYWCDERKHDWWMVIRIGIMRFCISSGLMTVTTYRKKKSIEIDYD